MRFRVLLSLAAFSLFAGTAAGKTVSFTCAGSTILLLDSTQAAKENRMTDAYTDSHTDFDLEIRLNKATNVAEREYLELAAKEARNWTPAEELQLRKAYAHIDSMARATGIHLHLPDTVEMVRTHGKEEFGAEGYTRSNRIMLNTDAQPIDLHLVAHELWHVISRTHPKVRDEAYAVFHFKPCNNIVYKPAMHDRVITNPDCPFLMHYITIQVDGKPQDGALILYSKNDYHEGYGLQEYAAIGFLGLTGDDAYKTPLLKNGEPVIYELQNVPDLFQQIGMNTQYLLHIEEVTAEHFSALMGGSNMKQIEYVTGLGKVLKG